MKLTSGLSHKESWFWKSWKNGT